MAATLKSSDREVAREIMIAWLSNNAVATALATDGSGFHPSDMGKKIGEVYKALLKAVGDAHKP